MILLCVYDFHFPVFLPFLVEHVIDVTRNIDQMTVLDEEPVMPRTLRQNTFVVDRNDRNVLFLTGDRKDSHKSHSKVAPDDASSSRKKLENQMNKKVMVNSKLGSGDGK